MTESSAYSGVDEELLKVLVCPETKQALTVADAALLEKLNRAVTAGKLQNRAGKKVDQKLEAGLVRADGARLYPIREGIPVMLVEEAIPCT